jgi:hypothetical protein
LYRIAVALFTISEDKIIVYKERADLEIVLNNIGSSISSEVILNVAWGVSINDEDLDLFVRYFTGGK